MGAVQAYEFIKVFQKCQLHRTYRTITLLGDNDLDNILLLGFLIIIVIPVQERYNIGILLDRTGFPKSDIIGRLS